MNNTRVNVTPCQYRRIMVKFSFRNVPEFAPSPGHRRATPGIMLRHRRMSINTIKNALNIVITRITPYARRQGRIRVGHWGLYATQTTSNNHLLNNNNAHAFTTVMESTIIVWNNASVIITANGSECLRPMSPFVNNARINKRRHQYLCHQWESPTNNWGLWAPTHRNFPTGRTELNVTYRRYHEWQVIGIMPNNTE